MKEHITNTGSLFARTKTAKMSLLHVLACALLLLMARNADAQIVYQDISPDLAGATVTDTVLGQTFQWTMLNGNQPAFSASSADSLIMVTPSQGNRMLRLSPGDTIQPTSSWNIDSWNGPSAAVASVNKYLGFRVGTPGNYRYGWFKIDINSATPEWTIKSYAYEQTPNKFIIAGDAGNTSTGDDSDDIEITSITINAQEDTLTINTNGGSIQITITISPANATHQDVAWSVQNITGLATISQTGLLTAQSNGTVKVIAMAQDGSGMSDTMTVLISGQTTIGIADVDELRGIFYPNPAKEEVVLQFDREERISNVTVRNLIGQAVYVDTRTITTKQISVPVGFLPEGLYILTYKNTAGRQGSQQFVKIK